MSENIGRRGFVQRASAGAAAVGAAAAGGTGLLGGTGSARSAVRPVAGTPGPGTASADAAGVIAHVVDAKKGEISILVGTREIKYTDREMAQRLLRAAAR